MHNGKGVVRVQLDSDRRLIELRRDIFTSWVSAIHAFICTHDLEKHCDI